MCTDMIELGIDGEVSRTPNAILFNVGEEEPLWIPMSCMDLYSYAEGDKTIFVKEWFAKKEGLI